MVMMNRVKEVHALPDYRLDILFRNGERGVFDCNPYRGYECVSGIWENGVFDKVVADHGTVMWPNGADLCPEIREINLCLFHFQIPSVRHYAAFRRRS